MEALERYRVEHPELKSEPMTYAGRLDPMAEGELLILAGDECKNKERYLGLDKEYEMEVVFGVETDTYDALGLAESVTGPLGNAFAPSALHLSEAQLYISKASLRLTEAALDRYVGRFAQEYPPYSSKTFKGRQLHELARADGLPEADEMPKKDVEIYSIETVGAMQKYSAAELDGIISDKIRRVKGDFRQKEIIARWNEILIDPAAQFDVLKIRVKCSSGTYMRSLADRMGKDAGTGAFALSIKRTKIFL